MTDQAHNVWSDAWEFESDADWAAPRATRLPRGAQLGATVYELREGETGGLYHFHHGTEELLVVLRGDATLRTPGGERDLGPGAVVLFPVGPDGAHQISNRGREPVRYLMVSTRPSPEAVEYPDTRQLSVMALTPSQLGTALWDIRTLDAD